MNTSVASKTPEFGRVVPTKEKKSKEIITIMKNVKCPSCGKLIWVKGIANTRKTAAIPIMISFSFEILRSEKILS